MDDFSYCIIDVSPCKICNDLEGYRNTLTDHLEDGGVLLQEALEFVTCLKVNSDDETSHSLCSSCFERLVDAYRFKIEAINAFTTLESFSCKIQPELETVTEIDITNNITEEPDGMPISPKIDMSTDAVAFLIEHQRIIKEEEKLQAESIDVDVDWVSMCRRKTCKVRDRNFNKYECKLCDKSFPKKSNLVDHLRLHVNLKKFTCSYCDKRFVQVANYRTHLRIHTNERPFKCNICDKAYTQSSTLKVHIRSHTKERNYACDICGKKFTNSSDMRKHRRVHDQSQHFKCEICGKLFAQKVNMLSHQKKSHSMSMR